VRRWATATCVAVILAVGSSAAFAASAPDLSLTPGASDPRVTQATIGETICTRGYTSTVRNVSTQTKHRVYVEYGISRSQQRGYVIDHLIPLEVGGANDITNLWPEPKADAKTKDKLENELHASVCNGSISLADAQERFTSLATPSTSPPRAAPAATEPPPTEPPATAAPAPEPPAPSAHVVHPGAFCAPVGARGITTAGTPMVCGPASDGRNRWHVG
jgi:hypothetical protein